MIVDTILPIIHYVAIGLFFIAISIFFYINFSIIQEKFNELKQTSFQGEGSFLQHAKYFTVTEQEMGRMNVLSAVFFGFGGLYLRTGVLGIIGGALLGWFLPKLFLGYYRKRYYKKMDTQIYSALILLGNAMRAGETLPQAVDSVKGVIGYPISQEIDIVSRQLRMGRTLNDALEDLANRVPLEDMSLAVRAMIISIRTGANLPEALRKIAKTIRERNALHQKINALTVQGKAQGIVVGLLPVLMGAFLYWSDPSYIEILFRTFAGNCILAFMVILEVLAFVVIRKISTITI